MNRLESLFGRKPTNLLSVYFTAGYPDIDSVVPTLQALQQGGVDMAEVGVPFSDPMADGPVIQESSGAAIAAGMTLERILADVAKARREGVDMPIVLMGYLNPFMQYGFRRLFESCAKAGVDALIIPDLPFEEYVRDFQGLSREFGVPLVMLITPETSDERVRLIDSECDGFIYMVSAASTTGTRQAFSSDQRSYFGRIDAMCLNHPRLIGFGVSNASTYADACRHASGGIVGSLFVNCQKESSTPAEAVERLMAALGLN